MKNLLLYALGILFLVCSISTNSFAQKNMKKHELPPKVFSIDTNNDGNYEISEIDEDSYPVPIQGNDQWKKDFYSKLLYPASARRSGVSGIVILEIEVDETGKVTTVAIQQGLSKECDETARTAFINATKLGYYPYMVDKSPSKFKMEWPIGFWLE